MDTSKKNAYLRPETDIEPMPQIPMVLAGSPDPEGGIESARQDYTDNVENTEEDELWD